MSQSASRLRFSLSTLIWASLLAGAILWIRAAEAERRRVETENIELRQSRDAEKARLAGVDERYGISVEPADKTKGRVRVRAYEDLVIKHNIDRRIWSWVLYLPDNKRYRIKVADGDVSGEDLEALPADENATRRNLSGSCRVYFSLQPWPDGHWHKILHVADGAGSSDAGYRVSTECQQWLQKSADCRELIAGDRGVTEEFDPSVPLVLARITSDTPYLVSEKPFDPNSGFVLWIEEDR